jgi:hypothetical protein
VSTGALPDARQLTIRPAVAGDAAGLRGLAEIDSAAVPAGSLLIGELDGVLVAAVSIDGGQTIADPFVPTAALVELLGRRAGQVRSDARPGGRRDRSVWTRPVSTRRGIYGPGGLRRSPPPAPGSP